MNTTSLKSKLPSVGFTVRQLVKECVQQAHAELRATHPKYRSYGGYLGSFQPVAKKEPRNV
ncbi:hypothetical protein [Curvibacter sp. AEP1-3]|uniref:hypothetical protein n=1 Tax=Curvibacter sp. AEP1-3 TaxID=1844971 RepID=UPI000B3CD78A|nr:hypothetical protein [Curvibacter sp. AEP1-3]